MRTDNVIEQADGNLLKADVEALVNTVNIVGVMGKGIALQFKRAFPAMFKDYAAAAKRNELALGKMHVWPTGALDGPRFIINFPTKGHWRSSSRIQDIAAGLDDLRRVIEREHIRSIAVPPLGCGHGGLDWADVEPLIREKLGSLADVNVRVFAPVGTPAAAAMRSAGPLPKMTPGRAALIELLTRYTRIAVDGATQIEVQKLMYFLQVAGQPLKLRYGKYFYGPYADNLRFVLHDVEGHYLVGFGDGSEQVTKAEPLRLLPGATETARETLADDHNTMDRIGRVLSLVEGFESASALELLATVHWVVAEEPSIADEPEAVVDRVHRWSSRKERAFPGDHIKKALARLTDLGWVPNLVPA